MMHHLEPLMRELSFLKLIPDDIRDLLNRGDVFCKSYKRKETVYIEGSQDDYTHLLVDGVVKLSRTTPDGYQRILSFIRNGEVYGSVPLFDVGPQMFTAEAYEPCISLSFRNEYLKRCVIDQPDLFLYLTEDLCYKMRVLSKALLVGRGPKEL